MVADPDRALAERDRGGVAPDGDRLADRAATLGIDPEEPVRRAVGDPDRAAAGGERFGLAADQDRPFIDAAPGDVERDDLAVGLVRDPHPPGRVGDPEGADPDAVRSLDPAGPLVDLGQRRVRVVGDPDGTAPDGHAGRVAPHADRRAGDPPGDRIDAVDPAAARRGITARLDDPERRLAGRQEARVLADVDRATDGCSGRRVDATHGPVTGVRDPDGAERRDGRPRVTPYRDRLGARARRRRARSGGGGSGRIVVATSTEHERQRHRERDDGRGDRQQRRRRDAPPARHPFRIGRRGLRGDLAADDRFEGVQQPAHVVVPADVAELDRVALRQRRELRRQLGGRRHLGARDQHRHDADAALETRPHLEADEVVGVVEPARALAIAAAEPVLADQDQDRVAGRHGAADVLDEVLARRDVVDVHEDLCRAEARTQAVVQASGIRARLAAAIGDEDMRHQPAGLSPAV